MATRVTAPTQIRPATTRGAIRRWSIQLVSGLLALVVALALSGATYQAIATAADARRFPPPGQLVDVGGHTLHLRVMGAQHAGPTIVLEASAGSASPQWAWVQPALAERYRVVAYDRPGLGWSERDPAGLAPERVAEDLHAALQQVGAPGPYVLVGHSLGGLFVRVFAGRYAEDVAGMVLVDATHPDQAQRSQRIATEQASFLRQMRPLPLLSRFGVARLVDGAAQMTAGASDEVHATFRAFLANTRHLSAMIDEMEHMAPISAAARAAGDLGDRPLVVLSAGQMGDAGPEAAQYRTEWHQLHRELAALSRHGVHRVVPDATHLSLVLNQQHAQAVIAAVDEVAKEAATP